MNSNYYTDGHAGDCSNCEAFCDWPCEQCPYPIEPTEEEKEAQRMILDEAIKDVKNGILPFEF